MRVLIYKRTHPFDPNAEGVFGCEDCMGAVRRRRFQAVIGVGGLGAEPKGWESIDVSTGLASARTRARSSPWAIVARWLPSIDSFS